MHNKAVNIVILNIYKIFHLTRAIDMYIIKMTIYLAIERRLRYGSKAKKRCQK